MKPIQSFRSLFQSLIYHYSFSEVIEIRKWSFRGKMYHSQFFMKAIQNCRLIVSRSKLSFLCAKTKS